jgi:hypothetical protein
MAELDDNLEDEIRRQVKEQFDRTIEIPDGLTEDEAVASVSSNGRTLRSSNSDAPIRRQYRNHLPA